MQYALRWVVALFIVTYGSTMEVIDLVYEAAVVPELWTKVLRSLADLSGSIGSTLFVFDDCGASRGITLDNLRDLLPEFLAADTLGFPGSIARMCDSRPNNFVEVDTYLTPDEIRNDPIRIKLRERGIGAHVCTSVQMPGGELMIYLLQKSIDAGRYEPETIERLNRLRPHLARAGLIAAALGLEHARGTLAAMEALGLAAAVCSNGRVTASNALFNDEADTFRIGNRDRVSVSNAAANARLQSALQDYASGEDSRVRSIPLPATAERAPGVLHALPLRRSARDLFSGGDTILAFTTVDATGIVPSPDILSGLFDLAPSEARLAVSLAAGNPLKTAAAASDIKLSTARSYLEQIFRKTGTNQQSQLVALLKSASLVRER